MSDGATFAAGWLRQRDDGVQAIQQIEDAELRALGDGEALRLADALLSVPFEAMESRRTTSGLVEQQRLLSRTRR